MIEFPLTPITDDTFERQGWEMIAEKEEGGDYDLSSEQPLPGMLEQLLRKLATIMG